MLVGQQGHALEDMLMLLAYSASLGIPFLISALLIDQLKSTFDAIKRHYSLINTASGIALICLGLFMATGAMGGVLGTLA